MKKSQTFFPCAKKLFSAFSNIFTAAMKISNLKKMCEINSADIN